MTKRITITVTNEMQDQIERTMKTFGFNRQSQAVAYMVNVFWGEHDALDTYRRAIAKKYNNDRA